MPNTKQLGAAVQAANVRFTKLSKSVKKLKAAIATTKSSEPVDLMTSIYPDADKMTEDEYDKKLRYIGTMLLPLVERDPDEVYQEIYLEEEAKLLPSDKVVERNGW